MAAIRPILGDLPREIPIFPLEGALLLPGGQLPLNIFEPRYLAMVEDALGAGRVLGMILPDPAHPAPGGRPGLFRIGCLGRIVSFAETEDGRYLINLAGMLRYRVARELPESPRGYRRVEADVSPFLRDLDPPPPDLPGRSELLTALRPYFAARHVQTDWAAIERLDTARLVTTLCLICPFEDREKQALLEAATLAERAERLTALLQIDTAAPGTPGGRPS